MFAVGGGHVQGWHAHTVVILHPLQSMGCRLGPQLMALDRGNLTGAYSLDLTSSPHRAVARRLQLAALQDNATSECRWESGALGMVEQGRRADSA
jgi:hypothetical protein